MRRVVVAQVVFLLSAPSWAGQKSYEACAQPDDAATVPYFAFLDLKVRPGRSVAVSPDGKTVALGDANNDGVEIALWDFETGALKRVLAGHSRGARSSFYVMTMAFSPDGKTLASAGGAAEEEGEVLIWHVDTGQIKHRLKAGKHYVKSIAFAPDGKTLGAFTIGDTNVRFYDTATGKLQRELKLQTGSPFQTRVAFAPDLKLLASGDGGRIQVWEADTGRLRRSFTSDDNWSIYAFKFSPDGAALAAHGGHLWDLTTGKVIDKLRGLNDTDGVWEFSPDGRMLAFARSGGGIALWDIPAAKLVRDLEDGTSIHDIAFTPNGRHLVTSTGHVWDVRGGAIKHTLTIRRLELGQLAFSRDGKTLVTRHDSQTAFQDLRARVDSEVRIWDARSGTMRHLLGEKRFLISDLALTDDGGTLATWGKDNKVRFWDVKTGELRRMFATAIGDAHAALSPDGALFAVRGTLIDTKTARKLRQLGGDLAAFAPDGKHIATAGRGEVNIWNAASGKLVKQLFRRESKDVDPYSSEVIDGLRFSPDGKSIALIRAIRGAMRPLGRVEIWEIATAKNLGTPARLFHDLHWRMYSPDGRYVHFENFRFLSAPRDDSPLPKRRLPPGRIIAFSPDGQFIVTGAPGPEVKVWDAATITQRATLLPLPVLDEKLPWLDWVAYTPDGFFTGSATHSPFMQWHVGHRLLPAEQYDKTRRHPDLVEKALAAGGDGAR